MTQGGLVMALGAVALTGALHAVLRRHGSTIAGAALVVALACGVAWLANVVVTSWYFVDILRLDAWEPVALVEHVRAGTFRMAELWASHNEHRPLTGRVVSIACAQLTAWNHWWEFAALHLVAALMVLTLAWHGARPGGAWRVSPLALTAAVTCLVATMHWETWLRGFSVHILSGVLAASMALLWLCRARPGWAMPGVAACLTLVGQLSFGASLLVWPLGVAVLLVRRAPDWRRHGVAWLLVGAAATALYLPGLQVHPGATANPDVAFGPAGLARMAAGVLVIVGVAAAYVPTVFSDGTPLAQVVVIGGAALAVASWAMLVLRRWREDAARDHAWLFPAALGAFGLASCVLVSAGRVAGGLQALAASRYLIFSACFWASWILLLGMAPAASAPRRRRLAPALSVALIAAMGANSLASIPYMAREARLVRAARQQFLDGDVGAAAHVLYPDPYKLEHMRDVLRAHRLSVFRPGAP